MVDAAGLESMLDFVHVNGTVRFDKYMGEHLFSSGRGFYDKTVIISGKNGHFTTYAEHPTFAYMIYLAVRSQGMLGKDFLEIGGGSGNFKLFYLQHAPSTRYISIDASQRLAVFQADVGSDTLVGNAENLPFADGSINGIIFANELLDELSCRVFKISNEGKHVHIGSEGYVLEKNGRLAFTYLPAERNDFLLLYESFLQRFRPNIINGSVVCVSPTLPKAVSEMARVLGRGKIILMDYGFWDDPSHANRKFYNDLPFFNLGGSRYTLDEALKNPYETDITHRIDFEFAKWIAEGMGFPARLFNIGDYFENFAKLTGGDERVWQRPSISQGIWEFTASISEVVLEITK
ncbi:SAM-dependent methyltransferase [Candidatus Woesearchaeota archaeon]|nr:SAM-dependent methyltransferase [Candidatus Woesearchaeota archaeon]